MNQPTNQPACSGARSALSLFHHTGLSPAGMLIRQKDRSTQAPGLAKTNEGVQLATITEA